MAASSPPAATGSSPGAAEPGTPWLSETIRREQGSESHPFWSTSTTPEAKLPWECCPQPPPWCGVTVRRHPCTCLPSWAASATSCAHPFPGPESPLELCPSCILLFLAVGSAQQPWDRLCRCSLPQCPSAPDRDSGRSCWHELLLCQGRCVSF